MRTIFLFSKDANKNKIFALIGEQKMGCKIRSIQFVNVESAHISKKAKIRYKNRKKDQ